MPTEPTTIPRPARTLMEELAPEIASIRGEVYGMAGVFPYRLFLVVVAWNGGEKGRGEQAEVSRVELGCGRKADGSISPPEVTLEGSFSRALQGVVDEGQAVVTKLDPTYTETELCNYGRLQPGEESFYELRRDGRDGSAPDRPTGRYVLVGKPAQERYAQGWSLRLAAQEPGETFGGPR